MSVLGFDIRFYVGGAEEPLALREMSVAFERAGVNAERWGEFVFPKLIPELEQDVEGQIEEEGRGPHGQYKPLSPAYAKWKATRYGGQPVLVATGKMRDALVKSNSGHALRHYSASQLTFGTAGVPYASFHQTGTERGLPARPPFDMGPQFETKAKKAALQAVRELVKESRLDRYATLGGTDVDG